MLYFYIGSIWSRRMVKLDRLQNTTRLATMTCHCINKAVMARTCDVALYIYYTYISFHFIVLKTTQQSRAVTIHTEMDSKATKHRQLPTLLFCYTYYSTYRTQALAMTSCSCLIPITMSWLRTPSPLRVTADIWMVYVVSVSMWWT